MDSFYDDKETPATVFSCNWCGKTYSSSNNLRQHELIHTGEKPHKCHLCAKSFTQKGILTRHLITHSGEKPFICKFCNHSYALKGNLTSHMKSHMRDLLRQNGMKRGDITNYMETDSHKPFSCYVCKKRFLSKANVANHVRIHLKPTDRWYTQELARKIGGQIGTQPEMIEKRFSCNTCGKMFFHQHNLVRHQRVHASGEQISCKLCKNTYTHETFLKRHMKVHEKVDCNANMEVTDNHYSHDEIDADMSNCSEESISEESASSEISDNNNTSNLSYPDCDSYISVEINEQCNKKSEISVAVSPSGIKECDIDLPHDINKHSGNNFSNLTTCIIGSNLKSRLKDNKLVIQRVRTCNYKPPLDTTPSSDTKINVVDSSKAVAETNKIKTFLNQEHQSTDTGLSLRKGKKQESGKEEKQRHLPGNLMESYVSLTPLIGTEYTLDREESNTYVKNNLIRTRKNVLMYRKSSRNTGKADDAPPTKQFNTMVDDDVSVTRDPVRRSGRKRKIIDLDIRDDLMGSYKSHVGHRGDGDTNFEEKIQLGKKRGRKPKRKPVLESKNKNISVTIKLQDHHKSHVCHSSDVCLEENIPHMNKRCRKPKQKPIVEDENKSITVNAKLQDQDNTFKDINGDSIVRDKPVTNISDINDNPKHEADVVCDKREQHAKSGNKLKTGFKVKSEIITQKYTNDTENAEKDSGYEGEQEKDIDKETDINKQYNTSKNEINCDKPFVCSVCEKAFKFKFALNLHMGSHTGSKQHKCNKCKQSFQLRMALKMHMVTHN